MYYTPDISSKIKIQSTLCLLLPLLCYLLLLKVQYNECINLFIDLPATPGTKFPSQNQCLSKVNYVLSGTFMLMYIKFLTVYGQDFDILKS